MAIDSVFEGEGMVTVRLPLNTDASTTRMIRDEIGQLLNENGAAFWHHDYTPQQKTIPAQMRFYYSNNAKETDALARAVHDGTVQPFGPTVQYPRALERRAYEKAADRDAQGIRPTLSDILKKKYYGVQEFE